MRLFAFVVALAGGMVLCAVGWTVACPPGEGDRAEAVRALLVAGNNQFAVDLYHELGKKDGNLFFSPYSLSSGLAMTYLAARGKTAEEMAAALHFALKPEQLHPAFGGLMREVHTADDPDGCELITANALWAQQGGGWQEPFLGGCQTYYGAPLNEVDFRTDAGRARRSINEWASDRTRGKIPGLIGEGVLDDRTRFVLTNAIYFKGVWASPFDARQTKTRAFQLDGRHAVDAPLMAQHGKFPCLFEKEFSAVELPCKGNRLSMVFFLPHDVEGLRAFEQSMTADRLTDWLSRLKSRETDLFVPSFRATGEFSLAEALSALGMTGAFREGADFSGANGGKEPLLLSAVIHKATVEVNEQGAVATGSSAAVGTTYGPQLKFTHPFVFLIRDGRTDAILFLGRVADPTKS